MTLRWPLETHFEVFWTLVAKWLSVSLTKSLTTVTGSGSPGVGFGTNPAYQNPADFLANPGNQDPAGLGADPGYQNPADLGVKRTSSRVCKSVSAGRSKAFFAPPLVKRTNSRVCTSLSARRSEVIFAHPSRETN